MERKSILKLLVCKSLIEGGVLPNLFLSYYLLLHTFE